MIEILGLSPRLHNVVHRRDAPQLLHLMNTLLTPLQDPLAALWLGMALAVMLLLWRRKWRSAVWLLIPTSVLFLIGSTPLVEMLVAHAEAPYAADRAAPLAPADVAVALGGSHRASAGGLLGFDIGEAEDRVLTVVELGRRGAAKTLVLGGSSQEIAGKPGVPTMSLVQDWLVSTHLVAADVTNLGICFNTHDEAVHFKQMQDQKGWKTVLLVTSALHMRRAAATFRKAGIAVQPVACDFQAYGEPRSFSLFPSLHRLTLLSAYLHEQIGLLGYWWRGWI